MVALEILTAVERPVFEWQYRMAGGFGTLLMDTIAKADENNLAKLRLGFPNEVAGFLLFSRKPGWWEEVQAKMGYA